MSERIPKRLTWAEWLAMVKAQLPTELSIANCEAHAQSQLRAAVLEIQRLVPRYRNGHEFVYHFEDFVVEGSASKGTLPPSGFVLGEIYVHNQVDNEADATVTDDVNDFRRHPAVLHPWRDRHELTNGLVAVNDGKARVALEQAGGETFYVYPAITAKDLVSVTGQGVKADFEDDEVVPFDEEMAGCVADYVSAKVALKADNDVPMHDTWIREYYRKRRLLYLNTLEAASLQS